MNRLVAQVSNLPYRGFPIGEVGAFRCALFGRGPADWEIRDTAGWKSALRRHFGSWFRCALLKSWRLSMNLRFRSGSAAVSAAPFGVPPSGPTSCTATSVRRDAEHGRPEARAPHSIADSWRRFASKFWRFSLPMNLRVATPVKAWGRLAKQASPASSRRRLRNF